MSHYERTEGIERIEEKWGILGELGGIARRNEPVDPKREATVLKAAEKAGVITFDLIRQDMWYQFGIPRN
jgi:hypothetical protein